jgi:hypothetical protein
VYATWEPSEVSQLDPSMDSSGIDLSMVRLWWLLLEWWKCLLGWSLGFFAGISLLHCPKNQLWFPYSCRLYISGSSTFSRSNVAHGWLNVERNWIYALGEHWTWSKYRCDLCRGCRLHPCLLKEKRFFSSWPTWWLYSVWQLSIMLLR